MGVWPMGKFMVLKLADGRYVVCPYQEVSCVIFPGEHDDLLQSRAETE